MESLGLCAKMIAVSAPLLLAYAVVLSLSSLRHLQRSGESWSSSFRALPLQLATLCMPGGNNFAILRTSLATSLILSFFVGKPCALPAILGASVYSLFANSYMTFLKMQLARSDIDHSLCHKKCATTIDMNITHDVSIVVTYLNTMATTKSRNTVVYFCTEKDPLSYWIQTPRRQASETACSDKHNLSGVPMHLELLV